MRILIASAGYVNANFRNLQREKTGFLVTELMREESEQPSCTTKRNQRTTRPFLHG